MIGATQTIRHRPLDHILYMSRPTHANNEHTSSTCADRYLRTPTLGQISSICWESHPQTHTLPNWPHTLRPIDTHSRLTQNTPSETDPWTYILGKNPKCGVFKINFKHPTSIFLSKTKQILSMKPHLRTLPGIDHHTPKSHTQPKIHILGRRRPTPSHTNPWTQEKSQNRLTHI